MRKFAEAQAKADQDAADLADFESMVHDEIDYVLTDAEREEQDRALAMLPDADIQVEDDDI
jgi:hypothetical protein